MRRYFKVCVCILIDACGIVTVSVSAHCWRSNAYDVHNHSIFTIIGLSRHWHPEGAPDKLTALKADVCDARDVSNTVPGGQHA
jgi:hypothetical protein